MLHSIRHNPRARNHFPVVLTGALLLLSQCNTVAHADPPPLPRNAAPSAGSPRAKTVKPTPRVTISKKTTYITEPLREDGYPDYLRYLNEKLRQGVTPENNAAVLYARAFGPKDVPEPARDRFFEMLGIKPLPEEGNYFVEWLHYLRQVPESELPPPRQNGETPADAMMFQLGLAGERPWKSSEFPHVAAFLEANQQSLRLIDDASSRTRHYFPRVGRSPDSAILDTFLSHPPGIREATEALAARAMLSLANGDLTRAWSDARTIHRIAVQLRGGSAIDDLVGIAVESIAWQIDTVLLRDTKMDARQARLILDDLSNLPPHDRATLQAVQLERLAALDATCAVVRAGPEALASIIDPPDFDFDKLFDDDAPLPTPPKVTLLTRLGEYQRESLVDTIHARCDWDIPLRELNAAFDRLEQALAAPDRTTRNKLLSQVMVDAKRAQQRGRGLNWYNTLFEPRDEFNRRVAGLFVGLFMPAMKALVVADDRSTTQRRLIRLGTALAAHRTERGEYPESLDTLVPDYIKAIPLDAYDQRFVYRRSRDGDTNNYVLYSLGQNGKDDNGINCRGDDCHLDITFHSDWSRFPKSPEKP